MYILFVDSLQYSDPQELEILLTLIKALDSYRAGRVFELRPVE